MWKTLIVGECKFFGKPLVLSTTALTSSFLSLADNLQVRATSVQILRYKVHKYPPLVAFKIRQKVGGGKGKSKKSIWAGG